MRSYSMRQAECQVSKCGERAELTKMSLMKEFMIDMARREMPVSWASWSPWHPWSWRLQPWARQSSLQHAQFSRRQVESGIAQRWKPNGHASSKTCSRRQLWEAKSNAQTRQEWCETDCKHNMHAVDARQRSQPIPAFGGMILMLDRFNFTAEKRNIVRTNRKRFLDTELNTADIKKIGRRKKKLA